jgi:peptide/nickel transport system permease protein
MTGYIVRRLGQAVVVALGVTLLTTLLLSLLNSSGGDHLAVARRIEGPRASPQVLEAFTKKYGLDQPFYIEFWRYLGQLVHGNLGFSFHRSESVNTIFKQDLSKDALLGGISLFLAAVIAIPFGVAQAVKRNTALDYTGTGASFLLYAMPQYWLGAVFILIFAEHWKLFPGGVNPDAQTFSGLVQHPSNLVLPVLTLTLSIYALFSRYMRSSAIDVLAQDYMRTARAKGLPEHLVLRRHLVRNALVAVVTLVGVSIPGILTAGLIIEQVFNYPGIGLEYFQAAQSSDFLELLGITFIVGVVTVVGNLLADVGYAVLDPRVRY